MDGSGKSLKSKEHGVVSLDLEEGPICLSEERSVELL